MSDPARSQKRKKKKKKNADGTKKTVDRMEKAYEGKFFNCEIAGKKLKLQRWTLTQGLRVSSKLIAIVRKATPLGITMESLMLADFESIIADHEEDIYMILTVSIVKNNFESEAKAREWLDDDLDFADAVELMGHIIKLDIVPLAKKAGKLRRAVSGLPGQAKSADRKA